MRTSHINPKLSAYAQVHGSFDFNCTPMEPPATKVMVHNKPRTRGTWAPHGVEGWYTGPALEHYRCFTVHVASTNMDRVADTLAWFTSRLVMPTASSTDAAFAAATDLISALLHPSPASALSPLSDSERTAPTTLAVIFGNRFPAKCKLETGPTLQHLMEWLELIQPRVTDTLQIYPNPQKPKQPWQRSPSSWTMQPHTQMQR